MIVDGEGQVVFARSDCGREGNVLHLDVVHCFNNVGKGTQQFRHVSLPFPSGLLSEKLKIVESMEIFSP